MTGESLFSWLSRDRLGAVWNATKQDAIPIAVVVLVCAIIGACVGRSTTTTTSTAQLLLTPMPLRETFDPAKSEGNGVARMLARPLDVKTASTLCMSDRVLEDTRNALESDKDLELKFKSLSQLKNALSFEITVAEDTPYATEYSPVLQLTAHAATPALAKAMANTWGEQCVKAAKEFQTASQRPLQAAFNRQVEATKAALLKAEQDYEVFKKQRNPEYLQKRIEGYATVMQALDQIHASIDQEAAGAQAKAERLQQQSSEEQPTVQLEWTPSPEILAALGARGTARSTAEGSDSDESLRVEQVNQASVAIRTELALALGEGAGREAQRTRLDSVMEKYREDIAKLQEELGLAEVEDKRLARNLGLMETAYREAALNEEYARMAGAMDYPQLQFLSPGAEWAVPRFRRAAGFGFALAIFGGVLAAAVSLALRMFILPALRSPQIA